MLTLLLSVSAFAQVLGSMKKKSVVVLKHDAIYF